MCSKGPLLGPFPILVDATASPHLPGTLLPVSLLNNQAVILSLILGHGLEVTHSLLHQTYRWPCWEIASGMWEWRMSPGVCLCLQ